MFDKVSKTAIRVAGVQIILDFQKKEYVFLPQSAAWGGPSFSYGTVD